MNRPVQSGGVAFAVLLEAQVDRSESTSGIRDVVDDEPALQGIATPPVAGPVEATFCRVVERIALKARVVAGLELIETAHRLEIAAPLLLSGDTHRKAAPARYDRKSCIRLCVRVGLTCADKVAGVALQIHEVAGRRGRARSIARRPASPGARRPRRLP